MSDTNIESQMRDIEESSGMSESIGKRCTQVDVKDGVSRAEARLVTRPMDGAKDRLDKAVLYAEYHDLDHRLAGAQLAYKMGSTSEESMPALKQKVDEIEEAMSLKEAEMEVMLAADRKRDAKWKEVKARTAWEEEEARVATYFSSCELTGSELKQS